MTSKNEHLEWLLFVLPDLWLTLANLLDACFACVQVGLIVVIIEELLKAADIHCIKLSSMAASAAVAHCAPQGICDVAYGCVLSGTRTNTVCTAEARLFCGQ